MKNFVDLNDPAMKVITNKDSVIIPKLYETYSATLDVSGLPAGTTVITAGWIIVKNTTTGVHSPQKVTAGAYTALTAGEEYAGVLSISILASKPFAAIMTRGTVNIEAAPYKPLEDAMGSEAFNGINLTSDY